MVYNGVYYMWNFYWNLFGIFQMIFPIKKKDYKSIAECITSDQVSANTIALYFNDKKFYKYYKKNRRI